MLPKEILSHTTEALYQQHRRKTNVIYIACILAVIGGVIALPFIRVAITIRSSALIRPAAEITPIRSLVSGRVKESFISENLPVKKGDILYTIESEVIDEKEKYLHTRTGELTSFTHDLTLLINHLSSGSPVSHDLETSVYQQSLSSYRQKFNDLSTRYAKVKRDYDRNAKLHREKVIADAEFENFTFELEKAKHEMELLKQTQLGQWQSERNGHEKEYQEFQSQLAQLIKEKNNLVIKSPVSGTVQKHAGIYAGSMVFPNMDLAQISPDTSLIVEAYVSPNDIGLLKASMPVRFQVDAFNYNQWGLAAGKVVDISNDIQIINEKPVFKVKCSLGKGYLALKMATRVT